MSNNRNLRKKFATLISFSSLLLFISMMITACSDSSTSTDVGNLDTTEVNYEYSNHFNVLFEPNSDFKFAKYFGKSQAEIRGLEPNEHEENDEFFFSYSYDFDMNQNAEMEIHFDSLSNVVDSIVVITYHQNNEGKETILSDLKNFLMVEQLTGSAIRKKEYFIKVKETELKHSSHIEISIFK